jgi:2-methylisocitrate lyase-like PEP mutase family enzyme
MSDARGQHATRFRALHAGPELLVLPNAWDAASARVIEHAGARAIATSSAAVA